MPQKRKRKPNKAERLKRQYQRADLEFQAVIHATASTYTCSHEMATDLVEQTEGALEELEGDIFFNQMALEIWRDHTEKAPQLVQALADFLAERERHQAALLAFQNRFMEIEGADSHEHLDPVEKYRDLIRERLSDPLGQQDAATDDDTDRLSNSDEF